MSKGIDSKLGKAFRQNGEIVELAKEDDLLKFSPISTTGSMPGIKRFFPETGPAQMRIDISLEKAPAAYTKRRPCWLNALPACVADLPISRRFEQGRTQAAKGREKNDLERS
jgi:hypothetical protein